MIVVENKIDYKKSMLRTSSLIFLASLLMLMFRPQFILVSFLMFLIIEIILLSAKFTQAVIVDDSIIKIVYWTFLVKREIEMKKDEIQFKLSKTGSFRSPSYFVLDILQKKRKIYRIDGRDGFSKDDLLKIEKSLVSS